MRKSIGSISVLIIMLMLCACGKGIVSKQSVDLPDKIEVDETAIIHKSDNDSIKNKLLGTWKNEYWEEIIAFVDYETCVVIEGAGSDFEVYEVSYELKGNKVILASSDGEAEVFTIKVSDDELDFEQEGFENDIFTKVNDGGKCEYSVVGNWKMFAVDEERSILLNSQTIPINDLSFYFDGSYTMGSDYPHNGYYKIVQDGTSLCIDDKYYFDIEFPCVGVMLFGFENGSAYLYVSQ